MKRLTEKLRSTKNLAELGHGLHGKLVIIWILWWFPVRRRLGLPNKKIVLNIKINGHACRVHLNGSHDEFLILEEILSNLEYVVPVDSPKVIFDLGGNIGLSALFYAFSYPQAQIHTFEPSPTTYKRLIENVTQCGNIIPHQLAVTKSDGDIDFYDNPEKSIASSLTNRTDANLKINVTGLSLESMMNVCDVDYVDVLKFDIEGAEYDMFKAFDKYDRIGYLIGELHEDLMGVPAETILSVLEKHFELEVTPAGKKGRYIIKGRNKSPSKNNS